MGGCISRCTAIYVFRMHMLACASICQHATRTGSGKNLRIRMPGEILGNSSRDPDWLWLVIIANSRSHPIAKHKRGACFLCLAPETRLPGRACSCHPSPDPKIPRDWIQVLFQMCVIHAFTQKKRKLSLLQANLWIICLGHDEKTISS